MALGHPVLRVVELLASLSLATDLGTGQPLGHGLSTSLLSVSLAREMGCEPEQVRSVQQVALLRFLGCVADASETAQMAGGDDLSLIAAMGPVVNGSKGQVLRAVVGVVGQNQPLGKRARLLGAAITDLGSEARSVAAHCEVASMLARRLGLSEQVIFALGHAYERWDGSGFPAGLAGEEIPVEIRIAVVARDAELFARGGQDVIDVLRRRQGRAYDPQVVSAFARMTSPRDEPEWNEVLAAEPEPVEHLEDLDRALAAVADFVDLKSPWTRGHSPRVAELAGHAGRLMELSPMDVQRLERAALVHDLGRVGVENGIWDKPGPLSAGEWEKVRLHPYLTHRILSRCEPLATLGELASSHHERLNGSGYHRQSSGEQLSVPARVLAAADALAALTMARPHREAMDLETAASTMQIEVAAGRLDRMAVTSVLAATDGQTSPLRPSHPGGLTDREVDVLRLLARGYTNRLAGEELFISPKTVGHHVESIYAKIGVSTRAGATMYAMEHRLVE